MGGCNSATVPCVPAPKLIPLYDCFSGLFHCVLWNFSAGQKMGSFMRVPTQIRPSNFFNTCQSMSKNDLNWSIFTAAKKLFFEIGSQVKKMFKNLFVTSTNNVWTTGISLSNFLSFFMYFFHVTGSILKLDK